MTKLDVAHPMYVGPLMRDSLDSHMEILNTETNEGGFFIDYDTLSVYQESPSGNFPDNCRFICKGENSLYLLDSIKLMLDCIRLGKRLAQA